MVREGYPDHTAFDPTDPQLGARTPGSGEPVSLVGEVLAGRYALTHLLGCARPERPGGPAPGALEDIRQHEHGHVAPHAVASFGD